MIVRPLAEIRSSPGIVALTSFLVAFLERDAFCLPQACGSVNHWASGTADGLCLLPGTVTQVQPALSPLLHELSYLFYLQSPYYRIYLLILRYVQGCKDCQGECSHKSLPQELDPIYIQILFLMFY